MANWKQHIQYQRRGRQSLLSWYGFKLFNCSTLSSIFTSKEPLEFSPSSVTRLPSAMTNHGKKQVNSSRHQCLFFGCLHHNLSTGSSWYMGQDSKYQVNHPHNTGLLDTSRYNKQQISRTQPWSSFISVFHYTTTGIVVMAAIPTSTSPVCSFHQAVVWRIVSWNQGN